MMLFDVAEIFSGVVLEELALDPKPFSQFFNVIFVLLTM